MKLAGSVCIVTGSATGVGAACAVMLAGKGARVVVNYSRSEREARETMVAFMATGNEALLVQGDVANDADCRRIADAALERWGRIDGLVNNAGITKFANPADLDLLEAAAVRDRYADAAALGRVAQPEDVAEPVVWLLEGADFITGEILMVNGGVRLGAGLAKPVRPK
jgi:NAD(P)-dependent dehydrogenase (short-subunit alcohol dehydrogenase family)